MSGLSRRQVLAGGGALATGMAGCLDGLDDSGASADDGETRVASSFFVLGDFAARIAGNAATANTLVPTGQHGHGWEPGPQVQREVLESDALVYVGEGFQPWADDIVRSIRNDDQDVAVVEARTGVDLVELDGGDDHGDENDHEEDGDHDEGDDHDVDPARADPHFWLDPERAATAVENVASGLSDLGDGNADAYRENAEAYLGRLDDLDGEFADALGDASRDAVLVAGHNAFQYLADAYGFEVHALAGAAPDDSPTLRDRDRARSIIDEHDVRHVLSPVLESDRAAAELVADTDATEVLPITALAGMTDEWADEGWGYLEIMRNVNLSSLRTALDG